jgi:hypothetical protein
MKIRFKIIIGVFLINLMLPIGKQINLMHVADHGMISSSNIKGSVLDYLKPS